MASKVRPWLLLLAVVLLAAGAGLTPPAEATPLFDENYVKQWGNLDNQGTEVHFTLDQSSAGTCCVVTFCLSATNENQIITLPFVIVQVPASGPSPCTGQGSSTSE
jgi:hypothetical protein